MSCRNSSRWSKPATTPSRFSSGSTSARNSARPASAKASRFPHCRSLLVSKLELAIGRSTKGIGFDAIDKKPAQLFFLIVAPPQDPGNQYLVTLGRVALVCQELAKKKRYLEPTTPQEFIQLVREAEASIH